MTNYEGNKNRGGGTSQLDNHVQTESASMMTQDQVKPRKQIRPGGVRALPPKIGGPARGWGSKNGPAKTRYQMTQDRICDNVQKYGN
jgi:hypothetical protein